MCRVRLVPSCRRCTHCTARACTPSLPQDLLQAPHSSATQLPGGEDRHGEGVRGYARAGKQLAHPKHSPKYPHRGDESTPGWLRRTYAGWEHSWRLQRRRIGFGFLPLSQKFLCTIRLSLFRRQPYLVYWMPGGAEHGW